EAAFSGPRARLAGIPHSYAAEARSRSGWSVADLCGRLHPPRFRPCRRAAVWRDPGARSAHGGGGAARGRAARRAALHQLSPRAQSHSLVPAPPEPTPLAADRRHAAATAGAGDAGHGQYPSATHWAADRLEGALPRWGAFAAGARGHQRGYPLAL